MLTGKYRRGAELPSNTRLTDGVMITEEVRERLFSEKTFSRLDALEAYAREHGRTMLELAIGWLLAQPTVASVIAGAAKPGQVSSNAAAAGSSLSGDEAAEVLHAVITAA